MKREDVIKLGGSSALAALAALLVNAAPAQAQPDAKPTGFEVALSLDISGPGGIKGKKKTKKAGVATAPTPVKHVVLSRTDPSPTNADYLFVISTAVAKGAFDKCVTTTGVKFTNVWVQVWVL